VKRFVSKLSFFRRIFQFEMATATPVPRHWRGIFPFLAVQPEAAAGTSDADVLTTLAVVGVTPEMGYPPQRVNNKLRKSPV